MSWVYRKCVLQCVAKNHDRSLLQKEVNFTCVSYMCVAVCCCVLQRVAVCCSVSRFVAVRCSVLQEYAAFCSMGWLQFVGSLK